MTDPFHSDNIAALAAALEEEFPAPVPYTRQTGVKQYGPAGNPHLADGEEEVSVLILADGTTTTVEIRSDVGGLLGRGVARRRKGEPRNEVLGVTLASARAFKSVGDYYTRMAEGLME